MREMTITEFKKKLLVVILILFSINGIIFLSKFVAYVAYDQAKAGYITEVDIKYSTPAYNWAGMYGIATPSPWGGNFSSNILNPAQILEDDLVFSCFPDNIYFFYATLIDTSLIDWNNVMPATFQDINDFIGFDCNASISCANNTFRYTRSVTVGTNTIANVPTAYTLVWNMANSTQYGTSALKDSADNLIFAVNVIPGRVSNFIMGEQSNFQTILPINYSKDNNTQVKYYFTANPLNLACPSGEGVIGQLAWIEGYVRDSVTGLGLNESIIALGQYVTVSDSTGFYRIEAPAGNGSLNVTLAARKAGYENFISPLNLSKLFGNITVFAGNTTNYNISLTKKKDFSGPGQTDFTNVDVGPGQNDNTNEDKGPGIGPGIGPYLEEPKKIEGQDFIISIPHINRRLKIDNFIEEKISIYSFKSEAVTLQFEVEGRVADLIELEKEQMILPGNSNDELTLRIFGKGPLGVYNGTLKITGSVNEEIPIRIELTDKDLLDIQTLFIDLESVDEKVHPGDVYKYKTTLRNLLTDTAYPIHLFYTITDSTGNEVIAATAENVHLKTTFSIIKSHKLSKQVKPGDYIVSLQASYLDLTSTVSTTFKVTLPFYQYIVFGKIPLWWIMVAIAALGMIAGLGYWYYKKVQSKKKYHLRVEYSELPKPGPRNVYVGKIAETDHKAYFNLENFKVHTIVAGSTGGGKSFSAQGIIEEMLLHNVAVIVFDPTAQWTGMLRKLTAKSILGLYSIFGMKPTEARAFNGNIRQINNARELIDLKKYLKPGEMQVFACHKLDPKDMDIYVANAIREVFHANFDESRELRLMIVFDEVHRLLPKFGGTGEGFLQIERACREFRKWGIGVMLVSQVLSDFVGQIKANINTEIQMRTRDEGDLDRISTRYGKEVLQSLVKATVGTGMVENPAYNRGRPYFISFKPIRHSVERLSDEEIEKYNKYNEDIDQIAYELEALEKNEEQDVFDLKLELKLALDKVKSGNFNMVDIYLDGIKPRVAKYWEKLGKPAPRLEKKMVDEATLKAELEKAKEERRKAEEEERKNKPAGGVGEEKKEVKEKTSFDLRTEFRDALNFANGAQVTTLQELLDVLPTMDGNIFSKSVNKEKNDVEKWVREKLGVPSLADKLKEKRTRDEQVAVVGEEQKKPTKIKTEPAKHAVSETSQSQKTSLQQSGNISDAKQKTALKQKVWPSLKAEYQKKQTSSERINYLIDQEKNYPGEANIKYALGIEYQKAGSFAQAKLKYEETVKLLPNNPKAKKHLEEVGKKLQDNKPQTAEQQQEKTPQQSGAPHQELSPEKYFRLSDGRELRSYQDLKEAIKNMDEETIHKYVNEDKNDFASWVESALENKTLAEKIRAAHSKSELEEALA